MKLERYRERVDLALQEWAQEAKQELGEELRYAVLSPGKRLRPVAVLLVAEALDPKVNVLDAALSVEFLHTASLVVDDLPQMDDDALRRGRPALHVKYSPATALLVSFALIAEAYALLVRAAKRGKGGGPALAEAVSRVSSCTGTAGAVGGQWLDLQAGPDCTAESYNRLVHKKTARLFELPFVLGWLFGGGEIAEVERVAGAAGHFGRAFQLADDLEDWSQDGGKEHPSPNAAALFGEDWVRRELASELLLYRSQLTDLGLATRELLELGFKQSMLYPLEQICAQGKDGFAG